MRGRHRHARLTRDFDAAEIGDQPFGWNLPNWLMRRELMAASPALPSVRVISAPARRRSCPDPKVRS